MGGFVSVGLLFLAGLSFLWNEASWAYLAVLAMFEIWLLRRMGAVPRGPVAVDEAPYRFTAEEAALVERYRFYFTYPGVAKEASSVLAALGLSALVLAPWLTIKLQFIQAVLVGANLFVVGRLTRRLAPMLQLRVRANRGDREALRMLELHDPLWKKIREAVLQPAADPR